MKKKFKGFTLIELLVVVAIIGTLAAIGVVAYSGYTEGAKLKSAKSVMMTVGLAQTEEYANYGDYYFSSDDSPCSPDSESTGKIGEKLFGSENYIDKELGFYMCTHQEGSGFKLIAKNTGSTKSCQIELDQSGAVTEIGC